MKDSDVSRLEELVKAADCSCGDCSCEEFAGRLFELIDSRTPEAEAQRLVAHAASCPDCTELSAAERHLRRLVRAACCGQSAPEQLRARRRAQCAVRFAGGVAAASWSRTEVRGA